MRTALRIVPRGRIAFWIGASCLLLVLATGMQVRWMSHVNQSRRLAAQESLRKSVRLVVDDLEYKAWLLLGLFRSDAELELATPAKYYRQRLYMWHELSHHGPAVQRILVYDLGEEDSGGLKELTSFLDPGSFTRVPWDEDLVPVRQYIKEHGFRYGRGVKARWAATWMLHSGAMVLSRPIVAHVPSSRRRLEWPAVTGYLILKLDMDYIRGRFIPDTLNNRFVISPLGSTYTLDIAVDGNRLVQYEPVETGVAATRFSAVSARIYSWSRLEGRDASSHTGPPDHAGRMLLSQRDIPDEVLGRGTVQRVGMAWPMLAWSLSLMPIAPGDSIWAAAGPENRGVRGMDLASALRQDAGLPRLFVVGDEKHLMTLEARHVGIPLAEAIGRENLRLGTIAGLALALLLAATVMVTVARSLVARRAELKTDAATSLAHQLLTPITAIVFIGENITRGILGRGEKTLEYGGLIHSYGQRLQKIVDRGMQMSAMDRFERRYDFAMLDVSKVAENAIDDFRFVIEDAGFAAESTLATDLPKVHADAEALQQAISDLIGNAVKYGLPGRWLKVETILAFAGSGQEVQIRVQDRGPGIPARDASRIFEPYYRIDNRISKSRPGAGLGLKLVVEIVKGMGGTVTLMSEEGRGSVFTIHLPVPNS